MGEGGSSEILVRVTLSWARFGLILQNNVVIEAAPIAGWSVEALSQKVLRSHSSHATLIPDDPDVQLSSPSDESSRRRS